MPTGWSHQEEASDLGENAKQQALTDHDYEPHLLPVADMPINGIMLFDREYQSGRPEGEEPDIGEIELTYAKEGYRALYGFTRHGKLSLYAD